MAAPGRRRRPMTPPLPLRPLRLLLFLLPAAESKKQVAVVELGIDVTRYVAKFGYGLGSGSYSLRFSYKGVQVGSGPIRPPDVDENVRFRFALVLDEEFHAFEEIEDPCDRLRFARPLREVGVNTAGRWSTWANGTVNQKVRPHIWYFIVTSCGKSLVERLMDPRERHHIAIDFRAAQADGSEFSIEMRWMLHWNIALLCISIAFSLVFWRLSRAFLRSAGSVHPVIWTLAATMLIQYSAQACHTAHLWLFQSDGEGSRTLEVVSEALFMLSQVAQSSLLILIALGYTLLQSTLGRLGFAIRVCVVVAFVHVVLVVLGKLEEDSSRRYHEHHGAIGWALFALRLALYAAFLGSAAGTAREGGLKMQPFLCQFRLAGSLYFLAFPVLFLLVHVLAPYWRHPVLARGLTSMQMASNAWLGSLFLFRGGYFKVSSLSSSSLPGGPSGGNLANMVKGD